VQKIAPKNSKIRGYFIDNERKIKKIIFFSKITILYCYFLYFCENGNFYIANLIINKKKGE